MNNQITKANFYLFIVQQIYIQINIRIEFVDEIVYSCQIYQFLLTKNLKHR